MRHVNDKTAARHGTTLIELAVATAIMTTVFAMLMPLFVGIRNSADARWANLEMIQNARVLNEHLGRHLAQARKLVAVRASTDDDGYVEFEAEDGRIYRCGVGARGCIEFGLVGESQERGMTNRGSSGWGVLTGPVEYLRFACYDGADFSKPVPTPDRVQLVTWEARLKGMGRLTQGKAVTGACCLRVHH
jgi:type II secretory pathway pseudopilin PulG